MQEAPPVCAKRLACVSSKAPAYPGRSGADFPAPEMVLTRFAGLGDPYVHTRCCAGMTCCCDTHVYLCARPVSLRCMTPRLPLTKLSLQGKRWLQRTDYHTMRCNALPAKFLYYDGSIKVQKEPVKNTFTADFTKHKEGTNVRFLKIATALDPGFKNLKCLPKSERDKVWSMLSEVLEEQHSDAETTDPETPKKKINLLLVGSDSDNENEHLLVCTALDCY
nr:uncharacterized protein LOC125633676 [Caretta caretta]